MTHRIQDIRHTLGATAPPSASDDEAQGYGPGSVWVVAGKAVHVCASAEAGAAVWLDLSAEAGSDDEVPALKGRITRLTKRVQELEAAAKENQDHE